MVFEVSTAKKQVLEKLVERDWTPTGLAADLGKSRSTVYNHLEELHREGLLSTTEKPAKTRPRTEYSIGDGFIRYITAVPGQFTENTVHLTPEKQATLRIWNVPQAPFHPFIEKYWSGIVSSADLDHREQITAVGIYGPVARGEADRDSDIDFLVITADERTKEMVDRSLGSFQIERSGETRMAQTEAYTEREYRDSLAQAGTALERVLAEIHAIYDPERILQTPGGIQDDGTARI